MIDTLGLSGFFLLHHEILELAREVAVEVRGRGSAQGAAAAGPRPGLLGLLDRLLPHGALAHRPDRRTTSRSAASCTKTSPRCRTSTSTSRAISASG